MKKKLIVLLAVLIMVFSMSFAVYAEESPEGKPTEKEAEKSPKTGGYDVIYALAGVALLAGVFVISRKQLAALKE